MQNMLADALERLLKDNCTTDVLRQVNATGDDNGLWDSIESMGFLDILLPESSNGAGESLSDSYYLFEYCGKYLLPIPLAETVWSRAFLDKCNKKIPNGPISLAFYNGVEDQSIKVNVPFGKVSKYVLLDFNTELYLLEKATAINETSGLFSTDSVLSWKLADIQKASLIQSNGGNRVPMAAIAAASMAGTMEAILGMTINYASDRKQFGRPIAKFQAVQHMLSQMAERAYACRMAAMLAFSNQKLEFDTNKVAVAKANNSDMAVKMAADAHAVHGAIGFTEEFDLHLYTSRLHRDRRYAGSESYWQEILGEWLLQPTRTEKLLDTIRELTTVN